MNDRAGDHGGGNRPDDAGRVPEGSPASDATPRPPAIPLPPVGAPGSLEPTPGPTVPTAVPVAGPPSVRNVGPVTASGPGAPPPPGWSGGSGPAPSPAPGGGASSRLRPRTWLVVAVVAAVIGAAVGAGVAEAIGGNKGSTPAVVVEESNASPGGDVLSGNVSIPSLVKKVLPAVVSIDVKASGEEDQGTGMIIDANGTVVTNNHVIALAADGGGKITVTESGTTKSKPATLVGTDPSRDVAMLRITGASGLPTVTLGSSKALQVGDAVVAIGNALGLAAGTPTVTQGIVSALGRTVTAGASSSSATETLTNMIQTDAAINPGNSGGPLIDSDGQVIGMNTAVAGSDSDGTSAQDIGFAIPSATIESLLPGLEKGGTPQTGGGYLGVDITTLNSQLRSQYGFTPQSGAVVLDVVPGSPADQAGIEQGDVIVSIGSTAITSADQLQTIVQKDKPGKTVQVGFYRGATKHTVPVTLGSQSQEQQGQNALP